MDTDNPLAAIVGQTILETLMGPEEVGEGPELTGLCGTDWYYADLIVRLNKGSVLCLGSGEYVLSRDVPTGAFPSPFTEVNGETCVGMRVVDLVREENGEPGLFLLLEGGFYLESTLRPGGSAHIFGSFDEWDDDPEGLSREAISLISGQVKTWGAVAAPREPRGS